MTIFVKDLKDLLKEIPDGIEVVYQDPNFGGPYHIIPNIHDFKFDGKDFLISFPFESPVD